MDKEPRIALIHVKVIDASDPPLGLMYIGSYLKEHGFAVRLWDEYKDIRFIEDVTAYAPQVVGISVSPTCRASTGSSQAKAAAITAEKYISP